MRKFFKAVAMLLMFTILAIAFRAGKEIYMHHRYPLAYKSAILENALDYNLDPYLVASVIWVESKFDPKAVSGKGAMGLMQIMPETGEWIAGKMEMDVFQPDDLLDPETSIALGSWYLDYLGTRFSQDATLTLAAYNSGPARVDEWLKSADYAPNGSLAHIPYGETADFVERVNDTYEIYQELYDFYDTFDD